MPHFNPGGTVRGRFDDPSHAVRLPTPAERVAAYFDRLFDNDSELWDELTASEIAQGAIQAAGPHRFIP